MQLRIRELINERGLTAKQVAERTGMTESGLCNIIANGKTTIETIERMAKVFGVPMWELVVPCGVSAVMPETSSDMVVTCPDCGARLKLNINAEVL